MKEEILEKVEGVIVPVPEEVVVITRPVKTDLDRWIPKTEIGRKVKSKEIQNIDEIIRSGGKILEAEVIDTLVPNLQSLASFWS